MLGDAFWRRSGRGRCSRRSRGCRRRIGCNRNEIPAHPNGTAGGHRAHGCARDPRSSQSALSSIGLNVDMLGDEIHDTGPGEQAAHGVDTTRAGASRKHHGGVPEAGTGCQSPHSPPKTRLISCAIPPNSFRREMDAAGVELRLDLAPQLPAVAMDEASASAGTCSTSCATHVKQCRMGGPPSSKRRATMEWCTRSGSR